MTQIRKRHRVNKEEDKKWFGLILLLIGSIILLKKFDLFYFDFHSMWPWVLIIVGTAIGIKNKFRKNAWWILILIGAANLIPIFTIFGVSTKALIVPVTLIVFGLVLILKPGRKKKPFSSRYTDSGDFVTNSDGSLNVNVTFGGHKEIVTSKEFNGGRVSTTFGGAEINLTNADNSTKQINLDLKVAFGEIEIIVPPHWEIKNEISTSLGNVEDNRVTYKRSLSDEAPIVLTLVGSCSFGNIEIKSY